MSCPAELFDLENRLNDDDCLLADKRRQSEAVSAYNLASFYASNEPACSKDVAKLAACYNNLHFRDGYGMANGCVIDDDSKLRLGAQQTNSPHRQALKGRVFQGHGHFERGAVLPGTESELIQSEMSRERRPCIAEQQIGDRVMTPMVKCLSDSVQDPENIVVDGWRWGGDDTRAWVRDEDYLKRCGYSSDGRRWLKG